ncbi:hypothetical protein EDB86DRAFT_2836796 [Lactarius hatsudake]|nr:hypothetical protein EDB86DRAFT_2836796 [Lactarius hatsudake]
MSSRDVRGLIGVGAISVGVSRHILSHRSLRRLIAVEVSDPESKSDSGGGDGALARASSKTSQMRLMTSQSMPGVVGTALTVALETADGVGDTDGVRITHWVMSLDVQERYSPDEGGTDDDGGEYDIGDDEIDEDDSLGTSGSVSNNSVSNSSDSNGSDPNKLESSEWCDDRNDILELKELGERGLRGGGVNGMAMTPGLALPVTVGGMEG